MMDVQITREQVDEAARFLTGLDPKGVTLEWSREQLRGFFLVRFGMLLDEAQADRILYHFRDHKILQLVPVPGSHGSQYRWERAMSEPDA